MARCKYLLNLFVRLDTDVPNSFRSNIRAAKQSFSYNSVFSTTRIIQGNVPGGTSSRPQGLSFHCWSPECGPRNTGTMDLRIMPYNFKFKRSEEELNCRELVVFLVKWFLQCHQLGSLCFPWRKSKTFHRSIKQLTCSYVLNIIVSQRFVLKI